MMFKEKRKKFPHQETKTKTVYSKSNSKLEKIATNKNPEYSVDITFQINLKTKTTFITVKYTFKKDFCHNLF